MSNVRKSKSASRTPDTGHELVSVGAGLVSVLLLLLCVLTATTCLRLHSFVPSGLMLSVAPSAFPEFLNGRTSGKFISACVCVLIVSSVVAWFTFGTFPV